MTAELNEMVQYSLTRRVERLRNLIRVLIGKKKRTLSEIFRIGGQTAVTIVYGRFFTCPSRLTFEATRFNRNSRAVPVIRTVCSRTSEQVKGSKTRKMWYGISSVAN